MAGPVKSFAERLLAMSTAEEALLARLQLVRAEEAALLAGAHRQGFSLARIVRHMLPEASEETRQRRVEKLKKRRAAWEGVPQHPRAVDCPASINAAPLSQEAGTNMANETKGKIVRRTTTSTTVEEFIEGDHNLAGVEDEDETDLAGVDDEDEEAEEASLPAKGKGLAGRRR